MSGPTIRRGFAARFARKPVAFAALCYLTLVVLAVVFAGWLAPHGPEDQDLPAALSGPSAAHPLGAGELGKDVLSRILYGGRVTLLGVLISMAVFAVAGISAGVLAGYRGGLLDRLVVRVADVVYAVPAIIVLLVVLAIFPGDESVAMVALGLLGAPGLARVVRTATQDVRGELYIRAAVVNGLGDGVILRRHVLPRLAGPIIVQLSLFGAAAVALETGLGFLGLGVTTASWGTLVAEASQNIGNQPWLLVPSGFVIVTYILALGLVGDGVRDATAERHSPGTASGRGPAAAVRRTEPGGPAVAATRPGVLLSVRDLSVTFDIGGNPTEVVSGFSLDVAPGEAVGIVGESGSGKTVTATAILGLLRGGGRITGGGITFDGLDVRAAGGDRLRGDRIGFIGQDPVSGLDPSFTIGSQIAEVVRVHRGCSRAQARVRALELLALVQLPDPETVARRYPHQLSGGMAQRAGIAAALAGDPALVIADEPTTALDVTVQAGILAVLRQLREQGCAVLLITHDWGVLADLCDQAVVMYAGQVVEQGPVRELLTAPRHPYTAGLLAADPRHAVPGTPLVTIPGTVPAPGDWPRGCRFADRCPLVTGDCRARPIPWVPREPGRASRCVHGDEVLPVRYEEVTDARA